MSLASVKDGKFVQLTHDGATAWAWNDASHGYPNTKSILLRYIHWIPNAADDVICIRNGGSAGPIMFYAKAADVYDQRLVYYQGDNLNPVIDETTTTGVDQIVIFCVD